MNAFNFFILAFGMVVCTQHAFGQFSPEPTDPLRKSPPILFSTGIFYESWSGEGENIYQLSDPVNLKLYPFPGLGMNVGINRAVAKRDGFDSITGFSDLFLDFTYSYPLEDDTQILFSLSTLLPTGTVKLTDEQYQTASILSLSQYDFNVPFFGQGLRIAPGLSYVTAISNSFVVHGGVSYRFRGKYEPIINLPNGYNWGDELFLSMGLGFQFGNSIYFSLDNNIIFYEADKIGEAPVYDNGTLLVLTSELSKTLVQGSSVFIGLTYMSIGENRIPLGNSFIPENIPAFPGLIRVATGYSMRPFPNLFLGLQMDWTSFQEDATFGSLNIYRLGVLPTISINDKINIPFIGRYAFGGLTGYDVGLGFDITF